MIGHRVWYASFCTLHMHRIAMNWRVRGEDCHSSYLPEDPRSFFPSLVAIYKVCTYFTFTMYVPIIVSRGITTVLLWEIYSRYEA